MLRDPDQSTLREIGLLYLACTHGVDDELHEKERDLIVAKLEGRIVPATEHRVLEAVRASVAVYKQHRRAQTLQAEVERAAGHLVTRLKSGDLQTILGDLVQLARADGTVTHPEHELVGVVAREFGLARPGV